MCLHLQLFTIDLLHFILAFDRIVCFMLISDIVIYLLHKFAHFTHNHTFAHQILYRFTIVLLSDVEERQGCLSYFFREVSVLILLLFEKLIVLLLLLLLH